MCNKNKFFVCIRNKYVRCGCNKNNLTVCYPLFYLSFFINIIFDGKFNNFKYFKVSNQLCIPLLISSKKKNSQQYLNKY